MPENEKEAEQNPVPVRSTPTPLRRFSKLLMALVVIGIFVAFLVPVLGRARESYRVSRCQDNLKQIGLVFKMYANEHKGYFPPLSRVPGKFFPAWNEAEYADYTGRKNIEYPYILTCPSDVTVPSEDDVATAQDPIRDDYSYVYFGYNIRDKEEGYAFLEIYEQKVAEAIESGNLTFDEQSKEWLLPESFWEHGLYVGEKRGSEDGDILFRLDEGVNRFDVVERSIPLPPPPNQPFILILDRMGTASTGFNHAPDGANILFGDGHVEFITDPSEAFVLSPAFIEKFLETEARIEKLYADFVDAQGK